MTPPPADLSTHSRLPFVAVPPWQTDGGTAAQTGLIRAHWRGLPVPGELQNRYRPGPDNRPFGPNNPSQLGSAGVREQTVSRWVRSVASAVGLFGGHY